MEILQIRKQNQTAATYMAEISRIKLECGHIDHKIDIWFGKDAMASVCGNDFTKMQDLYNDLLTASIDHSVTSAFIIDTDKDGKVESWKYLESFNIQDLFLQTKKKYNVRFNYETFVDVNVTASDESDAYKKALEVKENASWKDDNIAMQLTENMEESEHSVTEI